MTHRAGDKGSGSSPAMHLLSMGPRYALLLAPASVFSCVHRNGDPFLLKNSKVGETDTCIGVILLRSNGLSVGRVPSAGHFPGLVEGREGQAGCQGRWSPTCVSLLPESPKPGAGS